MKKMVSLLLIVLFLTAACSSKATATSSSTATTEAGADSTAEATADEADTDVSDGTEAAASDTDATDEDTTSEANTPSATELSQEKLENGHPNPDYYWDGTERFRLKAYCWAFPDIEMAGAGYMDEKLDEKAYIYCKMNGWKAIISKEGGVIWVETEGITKNAATTIADSSVGTVTIDDGLEVNRATLEGYLIVLSNIANNPKHCPFMGTGISHQHYCGLDDCPEG